MKDAAKVVFYSVSVVSTVVFLPLLLEKFGVHREDHSERCGLVPIEHRQDITTVFYADKPLWSKVV